jgi:hypothetical protein
VSFVLAAAFSSSPIWGKGEEFIQKKSNSGSCILGTQTGCSTSVTQGLTDQIIAELGTLGYSFKTLNSTWVHCSTPCALQSTAADNLVSAAQSKNDYITLNSAFRSSAQQYLLYNWYLKGICSIGLAAVPGTSNHEGGRAIDTSYYSYWLSTLNSYGWAHSYPDSDPVHFDYTKVSDIASKNLLAFQRLYNRANPTRKMSEDGIYGSQTSAALYNAPCDGY